MGKNTKFWDRNAEKYAKSPIANQAAYEHKLKVTRNYFQPGSEVLEIGCGTGSTAIAHAPFVKHIRATDLSAGMLAIAKQKAADANVSNITFEQSTVEDLKAPDGSYDVVMAHSLLHLVEDKQAVMEKVRRALKPGGAFVTSTVCLGDMLFVFKIIVPLGRMLGLFPLVKILKETDLVQSFTNAGFLIDYQWKPGKGKAVFIVAKKPA